MQFKQLEIKAKNPVRVATFTADIHVAHEQHWLSSLLGKTPKFHQPAEGT